MHILGCVSYAVGNWAAELQGLENSFFQVLVDVPWFYRYMKCLHFSVALFQGELVMHPQNIQETAYFSAISFVIFVGNVWLVSTITTALTRIEIVSTRRTAMSQSLDRWITENNVSHELALKVQRSARKAVDDKEKNLPESNIE
eukprot:CAMPEP_0197699586 /NCGR_PEP_ID=MMETSP1338-20131121/120810_1 /TAXON_ID=43686 ORGANISM="Pelagodinium beii, Strain RCC1491" /NCGR_SAMPLE_ID=MMETSP1338 /ASSEMBLY_ACC=CAM_ASM_000754 /LENGTH=143 /DNA_ID=CAMNT_0043283093 /DNA_START=46 /DNA_END=474 /DNA_ORIENTATION=-